MSGFGGFGGFGSNSNNNSNTQQSSAFGGFGSTTGTSGGFGSSNTGTGFGGTSNTGGSLFGNTSGSGFGSGGFGSSSTSTPFGQNKTGFGSTATTSGGSLFGSTTATSGSGFGSGGFGSSSTAFGSGSGTSGGGLFGQSKPAFSSGTTGGGMFGSGSTGFGNTPSTTAPFGAGASTSFGAAPQNEGTGKIPFTEHVEKDPSATNATNRYQTITTLQAYQPWSLEELRLADYAQGRKHGNQNGQAGAFGTSTGFGGFGSGSGSTTTTGFGGGTSSGGGLFGSTSTSSPFGQQQQPQQPQQSSTTGFGSGTSGGLFGSKPATGSLFGSTAATSGQSSGGLFGTSGTAFGSGASTGFGSGTGTTGGGLFGSTQNKPAFSGFGSGTGTGTGFGTSTGTGFGSGAATSTGGGGLFGNAGTSTATAFGNQQSASTPFSFGQQNQQNQQQGQTGGGLFGGFGNQNQQQKPGGLFGSTTSTTGTGTGLFGQPAQQQPSTGGGLFGNQQQQSGGLFGNKPAGSGLFGGTTAGTSGGGLFGGSQPQQPQTSNLFGQGSQSSGGLFGSKPAATGGLGSNLFGGSTQQQQTGGTSLFGASQQQQQPLGSGSIFGNSQAQQQPQQQPQALTANLLQNPYGNDALFANIGTPSQSVGPVATPLSTSQKGKKQAIIPSYRLNPSASSRLITPQKRPPGYGFSYSTYGTPGSAISNASPVGHGNNLLNGGSFGRSLGKSLSTSNLRHSFSAEDSILNPGAFASTARNGTGSLKKLNINRNMNVRRSLFGTEPQETRKSVSFDHSAGGNKENSLSEELGPSSGALITVESPVSEGAVSPSRDGHMASSEMQQVNGSSRGKELAIVPENGSPIAVPKPQVQAPLSQKDKVPGEYWMKPTKDQIISMSREERTNVKEFTVGRHGCGQIIFSKVDLNNIPLDDIPAKIVVLDIRQATVYGDEKTVPKPPPGKGLNVPSQITLENSWPRAAAGRLPVFERKGARYEKHITRLKRVKDTGFVDYDPQTGEWTFTVEHYTTYGLDYDDDESMMESSMLDAAPGTTTPSKFGSQNLITHVSPPINSDSSLPSPPESSPDDTFDFKKGKRKHLPGQFDDEDLDDVDMDGEQDEVTGTTESFLDERSVGSLGDEADAMSQASESGLIEEQEMVGSFPKSIRTTEQSNAHNETLKLKSILKPSQTLSAFGTPLKPGQLAFGDNWTEQLQRTVSPKKQDRAALRAQQATTSKNFDTAPTPKVNVNDKPFTNSIDIMNALFSKSAGRNSVGHGMSESKSHAFEFPRPKRTKTHDANATASDHETSHDCTKLNWGPHGTLVYTAASVAPSLDDGVLQSFGTSIVGEHNDVRFARFAASRNPLPETVSEQQICTDITLEKGVPHATTQDSFDFAQFAEVVPIDTITGQHEQKVWELANILFDQLSFPQAVPSKEQDEYAIRLRKSKLSEFWKRLVHTDAHKQISQARSAEEKALMYLSGGMVEEACCTLIEGKNYHLATLVAQIGGDNAFREEISAQLGSWRSLNVLPEFDDHIRAIYELLAGNTCVCEGNSSIGAENKVASFTFSSRFQLDWRRSFGLRLWYGIEAADDIAKAVDQLAEALEIGQEQCNPVPWFIEQSADVGWVDPNSTSREDLLWSLLKLYARVTTGSVEKAFAPENVSGNPLDARLSFQLINLFRAREIGSAGLSTSAADSLTSTYASCLATNIPSNPDALLTACWTLLHLSEPQARIQSIRDLLDQHAPILDPPDGKLFSELLGLRIPAAWMYLSKALYARAVDHDSVTEAQCLIEAGEWTQAHEVVCRVVGPKAVIEGDSDQLRELLGSLIEPNRHGANQAAWDMGAGVYYDFIEMKDLERQKSQRWKELVARLIKALEGVMDEGLQGRDLIERAALQMMGASVAKIVTQGEFAHKAEGLRLPLTEDAYWKHSKTLSLDYYKAILAAAH